LVLRSHRFDLEGPLAEEGQAVIFAYMGPETVLPMTSCLAAAAGVVLMFGRSVCRLVLGLFRNARRS
jgi:hypothetical protein